MAPNRDATLARTPSEASSTTRAPITSEQLELIAKAAADLVERELARAEARRERREAQEAAESDSAAISN